MFSRPPMRCTCSASSPYDGPQRTSHSGQSSAVNVPGDYGSRCVFPHGHVTLSVPCGPSQSDAVHSRKRERELQRRGTEGNGSTDRISVFTLASKIVTLVYLYCFLRLVCFCVLFVALVRVSQRLCTAAFWQKAEAPVVEVTTAGGAAKRY